ncbi:MAG: amidohydrolase family protein [Christensenellaceae bacterium]|nr:amidohydrolase family protein [Christensenellaceae bacterium]MCI7768736.1 amidohydrolase family protein [Christensenellaceae bacterium]
MSKKVFLNAKTFDGYKDSDIKKCAIFVEDEKIVGISYDENPDTRGYDVIDLNGKFVVPGLVNPHVHLFGTGMPSKVISGGNSQKAVMKIVNTKLGDAILGILVKSAARQQLLSGVTTVRAVGDFKYSDVKLRDKINSGKVIGPRLKVSGPAITVPGGHGDGTFSMTSDTEDGLRALVRKNKEAGVDFIKICVTGGVIDAKVRGEPGEVKMNEAQTAAVVDEAHKLGLRVASHTESFKGVEITAKTGVDTVEHGASLTPEMAEEMKKTSSAMVVTYSPALPLQKLDPSITKLDPICVYNTGIVVDNMTQGAKDCIENDILLGMGTDSSCPFATQYNMWREVYFFQKRVGVSNAYALSVATLNNAKVVGVDDVTGTIEKGKCADMIVMSRNPLDDLTALRDLDMIVVRGKIIENPRPKRNGNIERELDGISLNL